MDSEQKAIIVAKGARRAEGLDELNEALRHGWRVVEMTSMGGGSESDVLAALVIIESDQDTSATGVMEEAEEVEEVVEEIVEGNGSEQGLAEERNGGPPPVNS